MSECDLTRGGNRRTHWKRNEKIPLEIQLAFALNLSILRQRLIDYECEQLCSIFQSLIQYTTSIYKCISTLIKQLSYKYVQLHADTLKENN